MRFSIPVTKTQLLTLALLWWMPLGGLQANGWEHAAISYEVLVKALQQGQAQTRARAAQSLGIRGQPEALDPLLAQLSLLEEDDRVRQAIYGALGHLGQSRALPALTECLEAEAEETVRAVCIQSLGKIADPAALAYLLVAAADKSSPLIRARAIEALGRLDHPAAVVALVAVLERSENASLKLRSVRALGGSRGAGAAAALLRALEREEASEIQHQIVKGLARHAPAAAVGPLTELLGRTEDPRLRFEITTALGAIREGSVQDSLMALLFDPAPAVRYAATRALAEQGEPAAAQPILTLSLQMAEALAAASTEEQLRDLPETLVTLSLQVEALRALAALDPVAGLPAFIAAAGPRDIPIKTAAAAKLAEGYYEQRRVALFGLGYSGAKEAAALLQGAAGLQSADARLRAAAVRALGVLGFPGTAKALIAFSKDADQDVRWTAARVLGRLPGAGNAKALSEALGDPAARVRKEAAISLGYLGDATAAAALDDAANHDSDLAVREAAADSLKLLAP